MRRLVVLGALLLIGAGPLGGADLTGTVGAWTYSHRVEAKTGRMTYVARTSSPDGVLMILCSAHDARTPMAIFRSARRLAPVSREGVEMFSYRTDLPGSQREVAWYRIGDGGALDGGPARDFFNQLGRAHMLVITMPDSMDRQIDHVFDTNGAGWAYTNLFAECQADIDAQP